MSCSDAFPIFWADGAKCYPIDQGCPYGTYVTENFECATCPYPCLDCSSEHECLVCDDKAQTKKSQGTGPLLSKGMCVDKCANN